MREIKVNIIVLFVYNYFLMLFFSKCYLYEIYLKSVPNLENNLKLEILFYINSLAANRSFGTRYIESVKFLNSTDIYIFILIIIITLYFVY